MPIKAKLLITVGVILIIGAGAVFVGLSASQKPWAGVLFILGGVVSVEGLLRRPHLLLNVEEDLATTTRKLKMLVGSARRSVFLTTGSFHYPIYSQLEEVFCQRLENHVVVTIISGDALSPESETLVLRLAKEYKNFHFYKYPGDPTPHGVLVDDRHLRVEKPHARGEALRNNVYVTKPSVGASLFMRRFDRYRAESDLFQRANVETGKRVVGSTMTVTETVITESTTTEE